MVTQQFDSHLDEESLFLFCDRGTDRVKAFSINSKLLVFCGKGMYNSQDERMFSVKRKKP